MKSLIKFPSILFMLTSLTGCGTPVREDINILFTTDVHCGIDSNIGYAGFAHYVKETKKNNKYVTVLDDGDFSQGDLIASITNGEYVCEIMNKIGYEMVTIGNHEFDYGIDALMHNLSKLKATPLSCNFKYTGNKTNKIKAIKPYKIVKYGPVKVGYVGVTTPKTIGDTTPATFKEDGEYAYSFSNDTLDTYYQTLQSNINECKSKGADYVIMLGHVGYGEDYENYGSIDIVKNTTGLTAFIDGHSHRDIEWTDIKDKDNKDVPVVVTGTKMKEFGHLIIKTDGTLDKKFISEYEYKDSEVETLVNDIKTKYEKEAKKVVATSDIALDIKDSDGIRMVRSRETTIGNLCADAYRDISGVQIAFVNGGGIRDKLPAGNITYEDIKAVHPYGNELRLVEATGQQILDYLELASMKTEYSYKRAEQGQLIAWGESGAFANVSGLKYTIDTSIPSSVELDSHEAFVRVNGERRVKNVKVLKSDMYVDIDPESTYTVCSHYFLIDEGGDGANMFQNCTHLDCTKKPDYEVLINYIVNTCNGNLSSKYSATEGRITVL